MKKRKLFLSLLLLFFAISSFGQNVYSNPFSEYRDGYPVQYYENDHLQIMASARVMKYATYNSKELVVSFVINSITGRYDLNPANVQIVSIQKNGAEKPLEFFSYADYSKRTKSNFVLFGAETGTSTATQNTSVSVKDEYGMTKGTVSSTTTQTVQDASVPSIAEQSDAYLAKSLSRYFRHTTLSPENSFAGDLVCQYSKKIVKVKITFPIGDDTYCFNFDIEE